MSNEQTSDRLDRNRGLGVVLRELRSTTKVTQAQAAAAMGLERTSVSNIEGGTQALTIEKLHDFAKFVGLDIVVTFKPKGAKAVSHKLTAAGR